MPHIDLSAIPLVDNHCHAFAADQSNIDLDRWRVYLTEASGPEIRQTHVTTTLTYRRLVHRLARFFDCEDSDAAVLRARQDTDSTETVSRMLREARFDTLILDNGFPPRPNVLTDQEIGALAECRTAALLRVEIVMQDLIAGYNTLDDVEQRLKSMLEDVRAQGFVGLKTIAAYRTGLDIRHWPRQEAEAAFAVARAEGQEREAVRIAHQPLLDTLLHIVFAAAAEQEVPVQFHTGYGDTDADMILANPLYLRAILENPEYRAMPVVLLHESYPYTRQGAYLAAMYDRVYLDLSYAIPYLGYGEMLEFTRGAFGVAPSSKLLYSSDGVWLPELHWASAADGRAIIGQALGEIVESGDMTQAEAEQAGEAVLRGNAHRLYGLS